MDVRVGLWRKLSTKKLVLLNCGVGEDSWESLGLQGDPVHSKGDQSWVFIGRNDAKAETPILWPPHAKCWLIGEDSDAGRDCRQKEKGTTEDKMAGWHHRLNGRESEWTPGVGDGQGGLVCCDSWGHKSWTQLSDWTDWLMLCKSLQSCPTLCDPVDYSAPGSSVIRILQTRILEWVAMPSSRESSWPRDVAPKKCNFLISQIINCSSPVKT